MASATGISGGMNPPREGRWEPRRSRAPPGTVVRGGDGSGGRGHRPISSTPPGFFRDPTFYEVSKVVFRLALEKGGFKGLGARTECGEPAEGFQTCGAGWPIVKILSPELAPAMKREHERRSPHRGGAATGSIREQNPPIPFTKRPPMAFPAYPCLWGVSAPAGWAKKFTSPRRPIEPTSRRRSRKPTSPSRAAAPISALEDGSGIGTIS